MSFGSLLVVNGSLTYLVPENEREQLSDAFGSRSDGPVRVETPDGTIELPATAAAAVRHLLSELATGSEVHVLADAAELTTQEAAHLLGLSRTYIVRLIDQGKLPAHLVGTHRRLFAADVLAYQQQRSARLAAVAEVTGADTVAGVPYR